MEAVKGGSRPWGGTGGPNLQQGHREVLTKEVTLELKDENELEVPKRAFLGQGTASAKALG